MFAGGARRGEEKAAPSPECALNPDSPAMEFHYSSGNRKAEPRAFLHTTTCRRHLSELLENSGLLFGWNADSRVAYTKADVAIVRFSAYFYSSSGRRKFNGITQKVIKNLLETSPVTIREEWQC